MCFGSLFALWLHKKTQEGSDGTGHELPNLVCAALMILAPWTFWFGDCPKWGGWVPASWKGFTG